MIDSLASYPGKLLVDQRYIRGNFRAHPSGKGPLPVVVAGVVTAVSAADGGGSSVAWSPYPVTPHDLAVAPVATAAVLLVQGCWVQYALQ